MCPQKREKEIQRSPNRPLQADGPCCGSTLEYLPSITLLSVACRGWRKAFCFGLLPKIPAVVNICNQCRLVVSVLLAFLLKVFKSILVAERQMGRGSRDECMSQAALPALLPAATLRTSSGRQVAPSTADVTAPHPPRH